MEQFVWQSADVPNWFMVVLQKTQVRIVSEYNR